MVSWGHNCWGGGDRRTRKPSDMSSAPSDTLNGSSIWTSNQWSFPKLKRIEEAHSQARLEGTTGVRSRGREGCGAECGVSFSLKKVGVEGKVRGSNQRRETGTNTTSLSDKREFLGSVRSRDVPAWVPTPHVVGDVPAHPPRAQPGSALQWSIS